MQQPLSEPQTRVLVAIGTHHTTSPTYSELCEIVGPGTEEALTALLARELVSAWASWIEDVVYYLTPAGQAQLAAATHRLGRMLKGRS